MTDTDALVERLNALADEEVADKWGNLTPLGNVLNEAADTIAAQAARIEALEAENERLKQKSVEFVSQSETRADQAMQHGRIISGQRDRIAALEEALREIANKPRSAVPPYDIARRALGASL